MAGRDLNRMTETGKPEALTRVAEIATQAGIRGKIDTDRQQFVSGFELPEGRSQVVYIRVSANHVENSVVITVYSPCHAIKKGLFQGLSRERAVELLMMNEQISFARYGMWESDAEHMIVASVDHILETLDPPELRTAMWHVAIAADAYEQKYGGDEF